MMADFKNTVGEYLFEGGHKGMTKGYVPDVELPGEVVKQFLVEKKLI
jgi:hypothetical protein